jgi:hypothetical protein
MDYARQDEHNNRRGFRNVNQFQSRRERLERRHDSSSNKTESFAERRNGNIRKSVANKPCLQAMAGIGSEDGCQSQTLSARQIFKIEHLFLDNASTSIIL